MFLSVLAASCQSSRSSNVSVDYYQIDGESVEDLDKEIRNKGPRLNSGEHAVAVARIRMLPNFIFVPGSSNCTVKSAKVNVDAKVTLPNWAGRKTANRNVGKAWDNIDQYTRLHEAYHVALAFRFAKEIEREVLAQSPKPDCGDLRRSSYAIFKARLAEHEEAQREFDRKEQERFANLARIQAEAPKNSGSLPDQS